ncbi:1618_t:CDS:2 [Funneliformis geosporum]|uniref:1618_t:CDS:1 n=1 Tax=Funneliformis geosporum TaxID=1117311 RepID=A0A9W4WRD8_9GLOM|nr:1618_t:CDS:2 [Funneliformis geosporum]
MQGNSPRSENLQELVKDYKATAASQENMEVASSISTTVIPETLRTTLTKFLENELEVETSDDFIQKEIVDIGQDTNDQIDSSEKTFEFEKKKPLSIKVAPNALPINDQCITETLVTPTQANPGFSFNDENTINLLHRRPGAPAQLNLVYDSPKNQISRTVVTADVSPSPLLSPKIIELRRSESFHNKSTSNDESAVISTSSSIVKLSLLPPTTIPPSAQKCQIARDYVLKSSSAFGAFPKSELDKDLLARLEQENSQLPPQNSTEFLLARLERQNNILDNDPKSVCIQSNVLKANLETVQSLIDDINASPTSENENDITDLIPILNENENDADDASKTIDWDFWSALIQDYSSVATKLPHLLSAKLQQGLPPKLRGLVWQSMCQASSTYLETMYSQLLSESSPYERIIERDLARTFPHIEMFKEENGKGQTMLWNVLKAYSLYDNLVGYCQGLGFLVGPLLMNMSEAQAFCVFVRLMETYDMRTMFTLNMEGLQLRLHQFSALLSQILPKLSAHFQHHVVHAAMFASQWFLSLFAYTYPLPLVLRIYDVVFAEGAPETIMRVAIALLKKNEANLLEIGEFEDLLEFLSSRLYEAYDNEPTGLIKDAMGLSNVITKAKLDQLATNYVQDLEEQKKRAEKLAAIRFKERLSQEEKKKEAKRNNKPNKPKRWSFTALPISRQSVASASSLNNVSSELSSSDDENTAPPPMTVAFAPDKMNSGLLHQQIEDLVAALSQLQKEHADVTEQLVIVKMEKMDLVTELEDVKKNARGLEKENKRMSSLSMCSFDPNDYAVGEGAMSSRRASTSHSLGIANQLPEDHDVTPRPSTEVGINHLYKRRTSDSDVLRRPRRGSVTSFMSMPRLSSTSSSMSSIQSANTSPTFLSTPNTSEFDEIELNEEQNKNGTQIDSALVDELIQVKMEKLDLMQVNDELHKRINELENTLKNSQIANELLQEKNLFLREEMERLDDEAAHAVYEQNSMEQQVKEVKELKSQNGKLVKENEKFKKEMEALKSRIAILEESIATEFDDEIYYDNNDVLLDDDSSIRSGRSSFLNFFTGNTFRRGSEAAKSTSSSVQEDGFDIISQCSVACVSAKRVDELEHMLADVKLRLAESEEAREVIYTQMEGLRTLVNGETERPKSPNIGAIVPKSKQDKRISSISSPLF